MSQTKYPVLKVRNKQPGITTGANVQVELDDKRLDNLSFLKIELKPKKVAKVTMEMYVEIDVEIEGFDSDVSTKEVGPLPVSVLSSLEPTVIKK